MPGLVPGIHVFLPCSQDVDGRDKPGHDEDIQYASVLLACLLVSTRSRLFSILPSASAKLSRSCAVRQDMISRSFLSNRGISSSYSARPLRVRRSRNSRRSSSFSTPSTKCRRIKAVTARLIVDLCVRVQCEMY